MSGQVSRGLAGEYQADERAGVARLSWRRGDGNLKLALAFQREVINHVIPDVQPDLIHCNDWMTGLIPAAARRMGIPCLFTVHNIHTHKLTLAQQRSLASCSPWGRKKWDTIEQLSTAQHEASSINPYLYQLSQLTNLSKTHVSHLYITGVPREPKLAFRDAFVIHQIHRPVLLGIT